MTFVKKKMAY